MKKLTVFHLHYCPHCLKAKKILEDLSKEEAFQEISYEWVEEREEAERAAKYDYYYVPTFYLGNEKLHEGKVSEEILREMLEKVVA